METYDTYQPHIFKKGDKIAQPKTRWIWVVFWILLGVTSVEVALAFIQPFSYTVLTYIFVFLTIVKAYYIVFAYMHLKDEWLNFKLTMGLLIIIISYFVFLMLQEGFYQNNIRLIFPEFLTGNTHGGGGHH